MKIIQTFSGKKLKYPAFIRQIEQWVLQNHQDDTGKIRKTKVAYDFKL